MREWHRNIYNIIYEMNRQSRFNAGYWMLGASALGRPRGRREEGSGWGTRVHPWQIHVDVWRHKYNIVKLKEEEEEYSINDHHNKILLTMKK